MVPKLFGALSAKVSGLQKAAFWLAFFSALSLVLGFLRDRILAHYFGAGTELDIYYASFEIPDIIFATIASIASASILIPIFSKKENDSVGLQIFINNLFSSFTLLLFVFSGFAYIFMPALVQVFFSGFGMEQTASVVHFSRILVLSPIFLGLSNFFGSIVQFERRFLLYSLSPLLYNGGIIAGLALGVEKFGVSSAIFGVVTGAFLHMAVQAVFVFSTKEAPQLSFKIFSKEVRDTFLISIPRTISISISGLVGLFFIALASKMPEGSIAALSFSLNLQSVLLSLIGVSYSLAAFPNLAIHHARQEMDSLVACLSEGLRHIVFWAVPTSVLFIVLRAHIVRVVLGSGSFSWSDTRITAAALGLFVTSIVFQSAQLFLTRAHYALGRTRLPLLINIIGASLTVFLALIFYQNQSVFNVVIVPLATLFKAEDLTRLPVLTLPLSFSFGAMFSALFLFRYLPNLVRRDASSAIIETFGDSLISSAGLVFFTAIGLRIFNNFLELDRVINVFLHGFFSGLLGIIVWITILFMMKNREIIEIMARKKDA